jgi:hypothetical protein
LRFLEGTTLCGIYGCIGQGWNLGILRALVLANEARGTDSVGFFDSTGKMIKAAVTPSDGLRQKNISAWLERSEETTWFCAGHTRLATRGAVNRRNSHPFRYGRIIGAHNGIVDAPDGYAVDSQYLFDTLSKAKGDYNAAWGDVVGYWGISWFDGEAFYLQVHNGELHFCEYRGVYYYSSSAKHLESCVGHNGTITQIAEGETYRFVPGLPVEKVETFVSTAPEYWGKKYGCSNATGWTQKYGKYTTTSYTEKSSWTDDEEYATAAAGVRPYDEEWREAWAAYSGDSEHDVDCNDQGH